MTRNWQHHPPTGWGEARLAARDRVFYLSNIQDFTSWRGPMLAARTAQEFDCLVGHMRMVREAFGMSKKNGSKISWKGFVEYNLTPEDRENFLAWDFEDQEVWGGLADLALSGYKVSFSFNKQNDSYICSLTSMLDTCSLPGYTLSSWGRDPYQAVRLCIYKHVVLADGDWNILKTSAQGGFG